MNNELTEKELEKVTAGVPVVGVFPENHSDELDLNTLDNVIGGITYEQGKEMAMKNPEAFRQAALDRIVEEQIKSEELNAQQEEISVGKHL